MTLATGAVLPRILQGSQVFCSLVDPINHTLENQTVGNTTNPDSTATMPCLAATMPIILLLCSSLIAFLADFMNQSLSEVSCCSQRLQARSTQDNELRDALLGRGPRNK